MAAVKSCLRELSLHCDRLLQQNEALENEVASLKHGLQFSGVRPRELHRPQVDLPGAPCPELPGLVSDINDLETLTTSPSMASSVVAVIEKPEKVRTPQKSTTASSDSTKTMAAARLGFNQEEAEADLNAQEDPFLLTQFLEELFQDDLPKWEELKHHRCAYVHRGVQSIAFRFSCLLLIIVNCVYTSVQLNLELVEARKRISGMPYDIDIMTPKWFDIAFTLWFTLELTLRMFVERTKFVCGSNRGFNLLDTVVVAIDVLNIFAPIMGAVSFFRIARVLRSVRIVRLLKIFTPLRQLRTMLLAILNSFTCLLWAFAMLALTVYWFGMVVANGVLHHFMSYDTKDGEAAASAELLVEPFGSVYRTMVSLFASITGGQDWMAYASLLKEIHFGQRYFELYCLFVFFTLIGVLNVVTGIFVDSAVCTRTEDEVVENFRREEQSVTDRVKDIFRQGDDDHSGSITLNELLDQMRKPWVRAYFAGLDIDTNVASIIFTLADTDGSGELTVEEFVAGILKMKGTAKGIDILAIMFDNLQLTRRFHILSSFLQDELGALRQVLLPGSACDSNLLEQFAQLDFDTAKNRREARQTVFK